MRKYDELLAKYEDLKDAYHKLEMENLRLTMQLEMKPAPAPAPVVERTQTSSVSSKRISVVVEIGACEPSGHMPPSDRYTIRFEYDKVKYWGNYYDEPDKNSDNWGWCHIKRQDKQPLNMREGRLSALYGAVCQACREKIGEGPHPYKTVVEDMELPFN